MTTPEPIEVPVIINDLIHSGEEQYLTLGKIVRYQHDAYVKVTQLTLLPNGRTSAVFTGMGKEYNEKRLNEEALTTDQKIAQLEHELNMYKRLKAKETNDDS